MITTNALVHPSPQWFKSSYSNGSGGECVECARTGTGTLVRDSKCVGGPVLTVGAEPWRVFLVTATIGGFRAE
jgi:hypothetical protein